VDRPVPVDRVGSGAADDAEQGERHDDHVVDVVQQPGAHAEQHCHQVTGAPATVGTSVP
jgi:hypothetical protein